MGKKLSFLRSVRAALVATNNRTDSSIITECKTIQPIANDRGTDVTIKNKFSKRGYVRTRIPHLNRTTVDKRK